jgi:hypothetical protein
MESLRLTDDTHRALEELVGQELLGLRSPEGDALSGWLVADLASDVLVMAPDSVSGFSDDARAEYFRLDICRQLREPQMTQWPGGPLQEWRSLANAPAAALPATVLSAFPVTGQCDIGLGHSGVEFLLSSGFRLTVLSEALGLSPMALQVNWHHQPPAVGA